MQTLTFRGDDAKRIIHAGLISTQLAQFTCKDEVKIWVYRGSQAQVGIKVQISKKDETNEIEPSK